MQKNNFALGLDLEKLKTPHSGLGQFANHLAKSISLETSNDDLFFYLPKPAPDTLKKIPHSDWKRIHQVTGIPVNVDFWHSIHQEAKYFPKKYNKLILTIHDLNFLDKYSGQKRKKKIKSLQKLVDKADGIVFISNYTQQVANKHLKITSKQIVIYNGLTLNLPLSIEKPNTELSSPFLFSIGIASEKKNFHTLIEMMQYLPNLELVLAGNYNTAYGSQIKQQIEKHNLSHQIKLLGEVSESEKNWLYQNCEAFVFPSKSEGFGLPVIESFYFGKPTIISNLSSLPEIGSNHAEYFTNFEPKEMANKINIAIESSTPNKAIKMKNYAESFSWKRTAQSYLDFYKSIK